MLGYGRGDAWVFAAKLDGDELWGMSNVGWKLVTFRVDTERERWSLSEQGWCGENIAEWCIYKSNMGVSAPGHTFRSLSWERMGRGWAESLAGRDAPRGVWWWNSQSSVLSVFFVLRRACQIPSVKQVY